MNTKFSIQKLAVLMIALFAFVATSWGQTGTFTKITSLQDLTDGEYIIAFDTNAMNSVHNGTYLGRTGVAITSEPPLPIRKRALFGPYKQTKGVKLFSMQRLLSMPLATEVVIMFKLKMQ
jgi:hypothetical protein